MESLFWVWSHLWPITAATPQIPSFAHLWLVPNYCTLAGIDYYKKVFLLHFPSRAMGSAMGDTSGRAATSFWKMNSSLFPLPLKRAPPVCCHRPTCTGRAQSTAHHVVTNLRPWSGSCANAAIISKAENEKSTQKFSSVSSEELPLSCLL